ncbi:MAG: hypothetical protein NVSMB1_05970 [Polyangiales bacterium]
MLPRSLVFVALAASTMTVGLWRETDASAASIIKDPAPPKYHVEIEPHLNLNFLAFDYATTGFGPGVRFGIPIMSPGFIPSINDSVAISFGADFMRYSGYDFFCDGPGGRCYNSGGFWSMYLPVTLQWNFWLTEKWSVFGEPGLTFRHSFNDAYCDNRVWNCRSSDQFLGAFYVGGRYLFSDTVALTLRAGYPTGFSLGISIF